MEKVRAEYGISTVNYVKPGVGETTRVLLRRVPWRVLVREADAPEHAHIRLLAAFDHRHVFLDPNPDAGKSFVERERLFKLPRSSWDDYD